MKWVTKATVLVAMLVSIPTAGCQISRNWQDAQHAAKAREETTVRSETYSTALPQNVDRSLERSVQQAEAPLGR